MTIDELKAKISELQIVGWSQAVPMVRPNEVGEELDGTVIDLFLRLDEKRKRYALRASLESVRGRLNCSIPTPIPIGERVKVMGQSFTPEGADAPVYFWRFVGTVEQSQQQSQQQEQPADPVVAPPKN